MTGEIHTNMEAEQLFATVIEIVSLEQLHKLILENTRNKSAFNKQELITNLKNLFERTAECGSKLFILKTEYGLWPVIAKNKKDIYDVHKKIKEIILFQSRINCEKTTGRCTYIHEFASSCGISDGNFSDSTINGDLDNSIYPEDGPHEIAYVDITDKQKTVYFDITAKIYSFSPKPLYKSKIGVLKYEPIMEGIIIVEALGDNTSVGTVYQRNWYRVPFDKSQKERQEILAIGKNEYFKENHQSFGTLIFRKLKKIFRK